MERTYRLEIGDLVRHLPIVRIGESVSIASFVMLGDTELVETCARKIVEHPDFPMGEIDLLLCPEAKAIPLTHAIARLLKMDYVVARKAEKSYMRDTLVVETRSITTAGSQKLVLDGRDVETLRGRNVAVIDDVISTGGSLKAMENLLESVGCRIVCRAAALKEDAGYSDENLLFLATLPIFRD